MALSRSRLGPLVYALPAAVIAALAMRVSQAVGPLALLAAVAVLIALVVAVASPQRALLLAILLIPFELFSFSIGGGAGLSPAEALFALTGIAWALQRIAAGDTPVVASPLTKPLAALLVVALLGLIVAVDLFTVVKIVLMWTSFFFIYQMLVCDGDSQLVGRILAVLALTGGIVGLVTAIGSAGQEQQLVALGTQATGRAAGSFGHPNLLAVFLAITMAASIAIATGGAKVLRPLGFASFGATVAGLTLSLSRGGLLAAGAAIAIMLVWRPFRRATAVALAVGLAAVAISGGSAVGSSQTFDRVTQRLESVSYSARGADPRLFLWRATPGIVRDHPLIGVGVGQFPLISQRYRLIDPLTNAPFSHAHNLALNTLAEMGLLGLAAFIWLAAILVGLLWRGCTRTTGRERSYAVAVTAALVAVAVQGMVDYTVRSNVIAAICITLLGAAVVLDRPTESAERHP